LRHILSLHGRDISQHVTTPAGSHCFYDFKELKLMKIFMNMTTRSTRNTVTCIMEKLLYSGECVLIGRFL
jgi:hypothetical protein